MPPGVNTMPTFRSDQELFFTLGAAQQVQTCMEVEHSVRARDGPALVGWFFLDKYYLHREDH